MSEKMLDSLTVSIARMDVQWITYAAVALDNEILFALSLLALVLLTERRREKIAKIALAALVAMLLAAGVKAVLKVERPCDGLVSKIACPSNYSFPSGHTIVAFTVMLAFLNKPTFMLYFIYAVFVAFTRIYLGVHSFEDVAGSIAFAPFAYYAGEIAWRKITGEKYAFRGRPGK